MTEKFELSRRKVLAGLGTIGVASAGVGFGTSAYFSDTETFENNRLTAGQLDLTVGWQESYSDWSDDETTGFSGVPKMTEPETGDYVGFPVGTPADEKLVYVEQADTAPFIRNTAIDAYPDPNDNGTLGPTESNDPCEVLADTPEDLDPTAGDRTMGEDTYDADAPEGERVRPLVSIADVKPGDFGQIVFPLALCDNPGYVWMNGRLVSAAENGLTEPERKDPDEQEGVVELLDEVRVALYYAASLGDYAEDRVETFFVGSLRDALDALSSGQGIPLDGDRSTPFDEIDGNDDAPARECFLGVNSADAPPFHFVGLSWYLPVDHANEIQTDSVSFDLGFYTEQCRHNDGSGMQPEQLEATVGSGDYSETSYERNLGMALRYGNSHYEDGSIGRAPYEQELHPSTDGYGQNFAFDTDTTYQFFVTLDPGTETELVVIGPEEGRSVTDSNLATGSYVTDATGGPTEGELALTVKATSGNLSAGDSVAIENVQVDGTPVSPATLAATKGGTELQYMALTGLDFTQYTEVTGELIFSIDEASLPSDDPHDVLTTLGIDWR